MRISKRTREEAIEALLCCAYDRLSLTPYLAMLDDAEIAGRSAAYAARCALNFLSDAGPFHLDAAWLLRDGLIYLEAAALLRDGWSPGDPVRLLKES